MSLFEDIWNKIAKEDGTGTRVITYNSDQDLNFIYASGFVDGSKYTLKQWLDAFRPSQQKDGSYRVSFKQWLEKEKFYYDGPVREPFNPLLIPEKEFTEAELVDMFKKCVVPSSLATEEKIPLFLKDYQQRSLLKNGKMMMTMEVKQELRDFLTFYPSPLRVLEVNVKKLQRGEETVPIPGQAAKTGFKMGASGVKTTQAQLESLLGGSRAGPSTPEAPKEELSVKDLQKQVKKRPV